MKLSRTRSVVYSLLPACALLLLAEGAARAHERWVPPLAVDYGLGFEESSRLFVPDPERPGRMQTADGKRAAFHPQSFWLPRDERELRVFLLGGSNVHHLQEQLPDSARRLAEATGGALQVEYLNAGGLAYGSQRLVTLAAEIASYEPDAVLIYTGHNEFEELEQLRLASLETLRLQRVVYRSALMRWLRDRLTLLQVSRLEREHNQRLLSRAGVDYRAAARHDFSPAEIAERMQAFRRNLDLVAEAIAGRGIPMVVGVPVSNLFRPDLPARLAPERAEMVTLYEQGRYAEGMAMARRLLREATRHQSSDAEAEIVRELARRRGLPLVDVFAAVAEAEPHGVPGETLFTDRCHLDVRGRELLLRSYEGVLAPLLRAAAAERGG